jgi:hypothetical protein
VKEKIDFEKNSSRNLVHIGSIEIKPKHVLIYWGVIIEQR